jgi:hypothetical protein
VFFSLGLFNVVMAILRARWSHIAFTNPDFSWHWALPVLWMTSEIAVAHICATVSVITMPLLRKCTGTATVSGCQQRNKSESSTPVGKYGSEVELLPRPI